MFANSSPVVSSQIGIHEQLTGLVSRHAASIFRKPILPHNRLAFDQSMSSWRADGTKPLILDAGCGVGLSSLFLATHFPDHFVIGIDQSADRLGRNTAWDGPRPANCVRVRADMVDFWRMAYAEGLKPARQYILYPNPWPKAAQLGRRWHGHPVFPTLVALGGYLECRSNWHIYIEEFAMALRLLGAEAQCESYLPSTTITPFEKKYLASGHALWRCSTVLKQGSQMSEGTLLSA